jgi:CRISPR/Cas system-associated exonuclease Cas4 (RecB family)
MSRYLLCPEQYRLYYVENLRPRHPAAAMAFGQIIHEALAALLQNQDNPVQIFLDAWKGVKDADLSYAQRDSWESMNEVGERLLTKFMTEELPKIERIHAVEESFRLDVTSLDVPVVGIIDLVADIEARRTVVDFKTSGSSYAEHEAQMSDQLTGYQLAEPLAEQAALCVLVKTKTPRIEWQVTTRSSAQFTEYLAKAAHIGRAIGAGRFYKRPGMWCKWCDYLPVCLGDNREVEESLVQIR